MQLTNAQRAMLAAALKKEVEAIEKACKDEAKTEILELNAKTGAKTFEVALESDARKAPIGTASVANRGAGYVITDFDSFADSAADAGELVTVLTIPPEVAADVFDALEKAGLTGAVRVQEQAAEKWQERTAEVAGKLVWQSTGEVVRGVEWDAGTTYVTFRPKSMELITAAARGLYGATPLALLEGGRNE